MFNHLEYDAESLRDEFLRDRQAGKPISLPANYFPDDDPTRPVPNVWRSAAHLLFGNWLAEIRRMTRPATIATAESAAPRNTTLRRQQSLRPSPLCG